MGAVKKVFKKVGSLFGIGGSSSSSTPTVEPVAPAPAPTPIVGVQDVSGDTAAAQSAAAEAKKKKRRGFASTQTSLVGDANTSGRDTLG